MVGDNFGGLLRRSIACLTCAMLLVLVGLADGKDKKRKKDETPVQTPSKLPDETVQTPYGTFTITDLKPVSDDYFPGLKGVLHNSTSKTWSFLKFNLRFHFSDGTSREVAERDICLSVSSDLPPNGEVTFGPLINDGGAVGPKLVIRPDTQRMEFLLSEESEFRLKYRLSLIKPSVSDLLQYEDDSFRFGFPGAPYKDLPFVIQNKTDEVAKLDWNSVAFVGTDGASEQVTHRDVKYIDAAHAKPPSTIPPNALLADAIVPVSNIKNGESGWIMQPILPNVSSKEPPLVGKTFGLLLPIELNGKVHNYFFRFRIDSVE